MVTKTKRKVKISRAKWLRGRTDSLMANDEGHMCCLGFAANQISHITKQKMCDAGEPRDIYQKPSFLTVDTHDYSGSPVTNNKFASRAMAINDNLDLSEKIREYKLKRLFSKHDIDLEFVD